MNQYDLLVDLCEEYFVNYWTQEFAGSPITCFYCKCFYGSKHSNKCPITRYSKIKEKNEYISSS